MKKADIKVGGLYRAKVNGRVVTVRVDEIREVDPGTYPYGKGYQHRYDVINLSTGRRTTFRSAAKFRGLAAVNDPARKAGRDGIDSSDETIKMRCDKCGFAWGQYAANEGRKCPECGSDETTAKPGPEVPLIVEADRSVRWGPYGKM